MPSIITTIADANFSALGLGLANTPFSVQPFAGYVLGTNHVAGTDYTNLMDFCGNQGALVPTGTHTPAAYSEPLSASTYYDTQFTLAQLFAAGAGAASMVLVTQPSFANTFGMGAISGTGARFNLSALTGTNPAMSFLASLQDDAGNLANFIMPCPGGNGPAQFTMLAASATATTIRAYYQNAVGLATTSAIAKASGTYTATTTLRIGATQGVGTYPGPQNAMLALFFPGDQYAYFPTLYTQIAAWMNEHSLGF